MVDPRAGRSPRGYRERGEGGGEGRGGGGGRGGEGGGHCAPHPPGDGYTNRWSGR